MIHIFPLLSRIRDFYLMNYDKEGGETSVMCPACHHYQCLYQLNGWCSACSECFNMEIKKKTELEELSKPQVKETQSSVM